MGKKNTDTTYDESTSGTGRKKKDKKEKGGNSGSVNRKAARDRRESNAARTRAARTIRCCGYSQATLALIQQAGGVNCLETSDHKKVRGEFLKNRGKVSSRSFKKCCDAA